MHMADALISPQVGAMMWLITATAIAGCARKVRSTHDDRLIPMMGVLGAFIFTAQMINFSIPATGSSGHLGGGLLLAILLGPYAAFLVIASILTVQALFFADGGILALGCNIFNLGFCPAFIAFPLLYQTIAGETRIGARAWIAALAAAILGLQLGAFGVVVETQLSSISELPFRSFLLIMQPIHLAIGIVEGVTTATIIAFVAHARPETMNRGLARNGQPRGYSLLAGWLVAAVCLGGIASWFASTHPDGLEWAITKIRHHSELQGSRDGTHELFAGIQSNTAILPDYGFPPPTGKPDPSPAANSAETWPHINAGKSFSGFVGGFLTLALTLLVGLALKYQDKRM